MLMPLHFDYKSITLLLLYQFSNIFDSTLCAISDNSEFQSGRENRALNDEKSEISKIVGSTLTEWFKNSIDYDELTHGIKTTLRGKVDVSDVRIDNLVTQFKDDMETLLRTKMDALRELTRKSEDTASKYTYSHSFEMGDFEYLDLKKLRISKNESASFLWSTGVHIPVEVYRGEDAVLRDLNWTGSEDVTEAFKNNLQYDSTIFRQYIATETGISRIFPASPWRVEPEGITIDLFDPRFRPWYTSAVTDPKDVLFLLDYSGSVHGRTLRLMKLTVLTILTALNENDYIHAVWYNNKVGPVLKDCFESFMPASSRNKILLQKWLDKVEDVHEANVNKALNYTFSQFMNFWDESKARKELEYGSGGHQMLMILTDKIERWEEDVFQQFVPKDVDGKSDATIRIFGLGMGFGTKDIEALKWMACNNKGAYIEINTLPEVKAHSRQFIPVLSRPLALAISNMSYEERKISWTGPYMDAQSAGPVVTLSMPILNTMFNGSKESFMGVSAMDIKLSAMSSLIDTNQLGPQAYVFAVDNNGQILVHPDHKFPEPDFQMVRRTACFKAGPVLKRGNNRVIFAPADEAIVRQMGLMDSLDQYDLLEIEPDVESVRNLRKHMIDKSCDDTIYYVDAEDTREGVAKQYTCRSFKGLGISVGIASTVNPKTALFYDYRTISDYMFITYSNSRSKVGGFTAPTIVCNNQLDLAAVMSAKRYDKFLDVWQNGVCELEHDGENPTTKRLLANLEATIFWREKFGILEENVTCTEWAENRTNTEFGYIFVQMDGGLTALYPKCPTVRILHSVKATLADSEYRDVASRDSNKHHFIVEEKGVTIVKGIETDDDKFLIAVSGMRTTFHQLSEKFLELSKGSHERSLLNPCSFAKRCYLVTANNLRVVAATLNEKAFYYSDPKLGFIEPEVFEALHNESRIKERIFDDYQADCDLPNSKYFLSAAPSMQSLLHNFAAYLYSFSSVLASYAWYFILPTGVYGIPEGAVEDGADAPNNETESVMLIKSTYVPNCHQEQSDMKESCILKRHKYSFNSDHFFETIVHSLKCHRKVSSLPVEGTNLVLLVVDPPCDNDVTPTTLPLAPKRISECEAVKIRYRRRLEKNFATFHPQETFTCASGTISVNCLFILLFSMCKILYI